MRKNVLGCRIVCFHHGVSLGIPLDLSGTLVHRHDYNTASAHGTSQNIRYR
jgi:hypothetical protein